MEAFIPGEHTYGVVCHTCQVAIPLFVDRSRGASPLPLMGPGKIRVGCAACETHGYYAVEEVVRMDQGAAD